MSSDDTERLRKDSNLRRSNPRSALAVQYHKPSRSRKLSGQGETRTHGVSVVRVLQTPAFATRHTYPERLRKGAGCPGDIRLARPSYAQANLRHEKSCSALAGRRHPGDAMYATASLAKRTISHLGHANISGWSRICTCGVSDVGVLQTLALASRHTHP